MFVNKACGNYNQKIQLDKHLRFRQDRHHKWVSSYFVKLHASVQWWKIDRKDIADISKLIKKFVHYSLVWGGSRGYSQQNYIWLEINELDEKSSWRSKLVGRLLFTVTVADPHQLDQKKNQ